MRKTTLAAGVAALFALQSGQMMLAAGATTTFVVLQAGPAFAEVCSTPGLDKIIKDYTGREPFNSDCNLAQYGPDVNVDLKKAVGVTMGYVAAGPKLVDESGRCVDPKNSATVNAQITQAIRSLTNRAPFASDCVAIQYNEGKWIDYNDLRHYVAAALGYEAPRPKKTQAQIDAEAAQARAAAQAQAPPARYSIQTVGPRASSLPTANLTGSFPVGNGPATNFNLTPKKPTPVDMAKLPVVKTPQRDAKVDFIEKYFKTRKTVANANLSQVKRIGGQDYFRVGANWFLQTSNDTRSRTGIEVPGLTMADLSTVTQTRTQDGRTYFKSGDKWMQLIGNDGSTLIGNDGSTLIGNDGSTLIGNDSAGFISTNGGTLVAAGGGNLVGNDGASFNIASLVGNDGASLNNNVAKSFISTNGSTVSPIDAARILSNANAALVAAGGGNMVAAGGGNMVAAGGGNLTIDLMRNLARAVPTNAGNYR